MNFSDLHLIPPILHAAAEIGYETPSPIQQKAIPPVLAGRDLLGCAQTGTGKTAAFAMPILQLLYETSARRSGQAAGARPGGARAGAARPIRALILTPTRELALQIDESFADYGRRLPLAHCVIFGGVSQNPQVEQLQSGVDILTATPGRLNDLIGQGYIDLGRIEIFVLDEADRMLDMGFVHDVKRVISHLPQKKQTLLFSATMPREIEELADSLLHNPEKVMVTPPATTVESIEQSVYFVDKGNKRRLLARLLQNPDVTSALVFTRTKHGADRVVRELARAGIGAMAIHGNKSQNARQSALGSFKEGLIRVLVATDIAARGIDITGLSHVFNYDLPNIPETYVHRIGRTGRAGRAGVAISFCDFEEQEYLADIEKLTRIQIPPVEHEWPMQIFEKPEKQAPQPKTHARPAGAQQTRQPKAHAQQDMPQMPDSPRENAALSWQKGDQPMEQKNNAPRRQANGTATAATSAAEISAGTPGTPAAPAAGAAQAGPGKKHRRRGGRRHNSGAQTAAAQAAPQQPSQQQPQGGQTRAAKAAPGAERSRTAKGMPTAGQTHAANNAPNAEQNRAAAQAALQSQQQPEGQPRRPQAENSPPVARSRKNGRGKQPVQPQQEQRAVRHSERGQEQNGAARTEASRTEPSAERDDSLQVIPRRAPAQKYASFEDYIKAHG